MSIVDTDTGKGTAHVQSRQVNGRKFWAWGNDRSDVARMNFLSSCDGNASSGSAGCHGSYLEMQAGVAPTQDQKFVLPAGGALEWTEVSPPKKDMLGMSAATPVEKGAMCR